ncbi:transporter substrate-binding domain-containing protein [Terasakiella sp. SH-1]|uniref:transporter substrate-binding domain-containing protein n=1 Tax=Terasakiella sp. SH-1 TaxID=2560057 RepID=UPI0010748D07|nr:transporter substrate-binding domain-containing protein [Terasakiella sp. SH-1]
MLIQTYTRIKHEILRLVVLALFSFFSFYAAADDGFALTPEEKEYLKLKDRIPICVDPDWMPFEEIDKNNEYVGISADFFEVFQRRLNIKFEVVSTSDWNESLNFVKERKCDILSLARSTPDRKKYLNFTTSYLLVPFVEVTGLNVSFIDGIQKRNNNKVGFSSGSAVMEALKEKHPHLELIEFSNIEKGLDAVRQGEVYGYIDALPAIVYALQKYQIGDLKIAGRIDLKLGGSVAVRNDDDILLSIMQKTIDTISVAERDAILQKWYTIKVEKKPNYGPILLVLSVGILIITVFIYFYYKTRLLNRKLNQMVTDEKHKREETSRFLSMLAHELKTPLAVIRVLLANKKITPEMIEMANASITEIDEVVSTSQMAERFEANALELSISQCSLDKMLEDLIEKQHVQGRAKISKTASAEIQSDPSLLKVILSNLIENAVKYGVPDKPIEIDLRDNSDQNTLILTIANYVDEKNKPDPQKLFDKYHRGNHAHRVTGSGLGLYLVKGFASLLEANIQYQPTQDKAVFYLSIPRNFRDI